MTIGPTIVKFRSHLAHAAWTQNAKSPPFACELHKLAPVFAYVLRPEALDALEIVVLDFNHRIRQAH